MLVAEPTLSGAEVLRRLRADHGYAAGKNPVNIETCAGNVLDGRIVCALQEYAPRPVSARMLGARPDTTASGRKPSIEMMATAVRACVGAESGGVGETGDDRAQLAIATLMASTTRANRPT